MSNPITYLKKVIPLLFAVVLLLSFPRCAPAAADNSAVLADFLTMSKPARLKDLVPGGTRYGYRWMSDPSNVGLRNSMILTSLYNEFVKLAEEAYAYNGTYTTAEGDGYSTLREIDIKRLGLTVDVTDGEIDDMGINSNLSLYLMDMAFNSFRFDNPQYYMINWFNYSSRHHEDGRSGTINYITPTLYTEYAAPETRRAINKRVEEEYGKYEALVKNVDSDYDKIRLVHDRMAARWDYSYIQTKGEFIINDSVPAHNILGVMDLEAEGPVCGAFANSFGYILHRLGVMNVIYISGEILDNGESIGTHAWNLVEVDGKYYHTDVTWDNKENTDPNSAHYDKNNSSNILGHEYFLIGTGSEYFENSMSCPTQSPIIMFISVFCPFKTSACMMGLHIDS